MGGKSRSAGGEPAGSADAARQGRPAAAGGAGTKDLPVFVELPEMISNLNVMPGRRASFVKLRARLELARAEDGATVTAVMPRLLDLFQTYLREMRPEELRGSMGTWRLREELIARANLAVAPARVTDVLFTELLVQ
ncbi:flagellar basal body protein FliL [Rhodovastum atsumiense]|uniref:Flagellar protein FliL n=2 Tax=Rhodovastum atsumiense TaxID=504468 RepID=A0A5M6ITA7_9PROT|nr:flagellar basal body protein FliL [Rhodovastum atsumiense]